ncbi:hypothetical protein BDA96_03G297800, partial [Sorghum bicolor]
MASWVPTGFRLFGVRLTLSLVRRGGKVAGGEEKRQFLCTVLMTVRKEHQTQTDPMQENSMYMISQSTRNIPSE